MPASALYSALPPPPAPHPRDVDLTGSNGISLLAQWLRENSTVGIIILTGRDETIDCIIGLEMGADDYIGKPHSRELLARVKSVLRRVSTRATEAPIQRSQVSFARWRLDPSNRELFSPSGRKVWLTTGEFDLLAAFVTNANQVLTRDRLLDLVHNLKAARPFDRMIDGQVRRLRCKLETDPHKPTMIKTIRGSGYIFLPDVNIS